MYYSKIQYCDLLNGSGIRTCLFVSGCSHKCRFCHNPQTHNPCYGNKFTTSTMYDILESLSFDYCSGLTLSGGDPLYESNRTEVMRIVETVKNEYADSKTIWLYTGYTYPSLLEQRNKGDATLYRILRAVDVLVDGPFIQEQKRNGLKFRGSSNQRILYLEQGRAIHEHTD